jgi:hypothetical protein
MVSNLSSLVDSDCLQQHAGKDLLHLFAVGEVDRGVPVRIQPARIGSFVK